MKNRDYKESGAGEYFHVFNRGNEKKSIFIDDEDYDFFIFKIGQNLFPDPKTINRTQPLPEGAFSLISYCLMPNHFHLLIRQNTDLPTSKLLLKICTSYSMYFNKKYQRVGHVFQDRFKQVLVNDNEYLKWLSAYIHQNPKVAGLVTNLDDYRWSSYPFFVGLREDRLCDKSIIYDQFGNSKGYKEFVESGYQLIKDKKGMEDILLD